MSNPTPPRGPFDPLSVKCNWDSTEDIAQKVAEAAMQAERELGQATYKAWWFADRELRAIAALLDRWKYHKPDGAGRRHQDCTCHMCDDLVRWLAKRSKVRAVTPGDIPEWSHAAKIRTPDQNEEASGDAAIGPEDNDGGGQWNPARDKPWASVIHDGASTPPPARFSPSCPSLAKCERCGDGDAGWYPEGDVLCNECYGKAYGRHDPAAEEEA